MRNSVAFEMSPGRRNDRLPKVSFMTRERSLTSPETRDPHFAVGRVTGKDEGSFSFSSGGGEERAASGITEVPEGFRMRITTTDISINGV